MNASVAKRNSVMRSLGLPCVLMGAVLGTPLILADLAVAQEAQEAIDPPAKVTPPAAATEKSAEENATPVTAPTGVVETLQAMDKAANQQQLKRLIKFYSADFTHSDGLTRQSMKQILKDFWKKHQDLNYKTELLSWNADEKGGGVATTKTTVTGRRIVADKDMALTATIHSRQRWLNKQMTEQTVTAEQSQLVSGDRPPEITVNLPDEVKVGETFDFDVIVSEPLDERLLLGTAIEEPISAERYLKQPELKLELLPAGGLFKVGKAPKKPSSEWISAVLVQDGGMVMISRRLNVVQRKSKATQSLLLTP